MPLESPIAVAVPTCNGSRHLEAALESIARSPVPHELLIVDDRSDDETLILARRLIGDRGRIEVNSERLGLANNWNRCVALSQSPHVAIFHQDDVMLAGHLETHLEAYRQNPNLGWIASNSRVIDKAGEPVAASVVEPGGLGDQNLELDDGLGVEALAVTNPLRCSAVTLSRSAHQEVGGFDPSYRYLVDWDFWVRVANVRPVAWRSKTTVAIRWHQASETHRFATGTVDLDETTRLLNWIDASLDIYTECYPEWRRLADQRLARAFLNRAHVAFQRGDAPLARRALVRSLRLAPARMLGALATDPRLLVQMGLTWMTPGWVKNRAEPPIPD